MDVGSEDLNPDQFMIGVVSFTKALRIKKRQQDISSPPSEGDRSRSRLVVQVGGRPRASNLALTSDIIL